MPADNSIVIIATIENYATAIVQQLALLSVDTDTKQQAVNLSFDDFAAWQNTRLHKLRKVYENAAESNSKPVANNLTEQSR